MGTEKRQELLEILMALKDVIASAGQAGIPSGHLYARLMNKMSWHIYQSLIDILVQSKQIQCKGHLLKAL